MNSLGRIRRVLTQLILVLCTGTVGYCLIEGWPLLDSLYMTVITLATIGYGEVRPLDTEGRIFTMILILGGMGIIASSLTSLTAFLVEGEVTGILRRRRMNQLVEKYSGHYIVCGAGKSGMYVLDELMRTGRQVVVVENNPERVQQLLEQGLVVVEGDASEDNVLQRAGVERAAGLVSALGDEKNNLFVVISARGLNPEMRIVAEIKNVAARDKFIRSGASATVSASYIGGLRMASELVRPATVGFLDSMLRDERVLRIEDVPVGVSSALVGQTVAACSQISRSGVVLLALKSSGTDRFNPPPETVIEAGDTLVVIGNPQQVQQLGRVANG